MLKNKWRRDGISQNRNMIFPVILIVGAIFLLFHDMGIFKWYQLRQERNQIQMEIDQLVLDEKVLIEELDRLENDDEYIKKIAGERFHMVKPGEKVFRVVDRRKVEKNK